MNCNQMHRLNKYIAFTLVSTYIKSNLKTNDDHNYINKNI